MCHKACLWHSPHRDHWHWSSQLAPRPVLDGCQPEKEELEGAIRCVRAWGRWDKMCHLVWWKAGQGTVVRGRWNKWIPASPDPIFLLGWQVQLGAPSVCTSKKAGPDSRRPIVEPCTHNWGMGQMSPSPGILAVSMPPIGCNSSHFGTTALLRLPTDIKFHKAQY